MDDLGSGPGAELTLSHDTFLMLCSPNLRRSLFLPLVEPSIFSLIDREPLTGLKEREKGLLRDDGKTGSLNRSPILRSIPQSLDRDGGVDGTRWSREARDKEEGRCIISFERATTVMRGEERHFLPPSEDDCEIPLHGQIGQTPRNACPRYRYEHEHNAQ